MSILVFLTLVITMLLLPNYPALQYYFLNTTTISNSDISIEDSHTLIGDLTYLAAITKRAADTKEAKTTPPPKPHKEITSFVYLLSDFNMSYKILAFTTNYNELIVLFTGRFIPVGNPPPKA